MGDKIILNFDESGNLGRQGRYFTIACVQMQTSTKPLSNVMKKAVLKTKKTFPGFSDSVEIKAKDSYPPIKDYFLRKIASKENLSIRYIVADLPHVKRQLLEDENLLYNYMLKFIIEPVAYTKGLKHLVINLDKRTIKVESINSFEGYIKIRLNYELNLDLNIEVNYIESQNSYPIQAADFIANAIYTKYEYGREEYYGLIKGKIIQRELFPKRVFGQNKIVNF